LAEWIYLDNRPGDHLAPSTASALSQNPVQAHAEAIARLRFLADAIEPAAVASAFVASLGSRKLEYRSALGSYAIARVIPEHPLHEDPGAYASICRFCTWSKMPPGHEEPIEHLLSERSDYGGVRHQDPEYAALDLQSFRELEPLEPTDKDWHWLELILRTPSLLAPNAKPADFERALKGLFPSNKDERRVLIQILACAGIIEASGHPGYFDMFVPGREREMPPYHYLDWGYPTIWWRASDGIRHDRVAYWFPQIAGRLTSG
jgi:hypothetical protein